MVLNDDKRASFRDLLDNPGKTSKFVTVTTDLQLELNWNQPNPSSDL